MNLPIISMNAGKWSPLAWVRADTEKHSSSCRELQNMIPVIYGPVTRRPGTKYIANVDQSDVVSRMVPFIFSATIAYELEFSDQIINVYYNGSAVDTDIVSPYLEADLFELQFRQSADILWIIHPSYAPRKLSRVSATEFTFATITFDKGPFIERNDITEEDDITMTVTGYTIATVTNDVAGSAAITVTMASAAAATAAVALLPANKRFYITGSTAGATNIDGAYTVDLLRDTTGVGTTLTVYPSEAIGSDPATNGQLMFAGGTVTLTASAATFITGTSGHTGALFKLTEKRVLGATKGKKTTTDTGVMGQAISVKGSGTFTTGGNHDSTVELQRNEDGTNWERYRSYISVLTGGIGSNNAQKSFIEAADNVLYRMNVVTHDVSSTVSGNITVNESTQDSIFRITATASTTSATATAVVPAGSNTATKRWAEGAWSAVRGYPSAITFFGERCIYGFTNSDQQTIWLSETGEFEDFEAGINDADSFAVTLPTANRGRWLGSLETLIAGTTGDEWRIRSTTLDEALTPKNWDIKKQTAWGSANIQAMEVNEAIIFIGSVARKVREHIWSDSRQKYVSPDLTALAEDITSGGITSVAVQTNPDSIIWFTIANSPYLISMTYEREQNVIAFAEHPLGGDGIAESVCITPSTSEDKITLTAQRTINRSTVRFIEEMQPRDWGSTTDATDSFFVDAGIVDTGGDTTIDGLDHLEGETVSILGDGAVQASKTVSSGEIIIDEAADRVVVGLPYEWEVSPMRPDITTRAGTSYGSIVVIPEIVLSLFATGVTGVTYGDGVDQKTIDSRTTEVYGSPPDLFTGETDALAFDGGFNKDMDIVISGSDPLPCTVRGIILRAKKTGR